MNIAITLSARDLASAPIKAVQASLGALPTAATAATNALGGLVRSLGAVGLAANGLQAVAGALGGLGDALGVGLASDVAESVSKVGVVFGASADQIKDFAATSAQSLGLARGEALATTGMFGNMFKTMGLSERAAATMSIDITKLGADLASFHNIAGSDALDKLRAGLVGESEPLRALGVLLTEGAVTAKGMQMGLAGANGQLSEAAKVQARYALILEQTKDAQGDFARTSTGMANAQRIIIASFKDMRAQIGERLLPVVAPLVSQFAQALPGALRAATPALDRFGQVAQTVGQFLTGSLLDGIKSFRGALAGSWVGGGTDIDRLAQTLGELGRRAAWVRDALLTFRGALQGRWVGGGSDIDRLHQLVGDLGREFGSLVTRARAAWTVISEAFGQGGFPAAIKAALGIFVDSRLSFIETLAGWGAALVEWVAPFIPPMLEELGRLAGRVFAWAQAKAPAVLEKLQTWGAALWQWIEPQIDPMLAKLRDLAGRLFDWIYRQSGPILGKLVDEWIPAFLGWLVNLGGKLITKGVAEFDRFTAWLAGPENLKRIESSVATWTQGALEGLARMLVGLVQRANEHQGIKDSLNSIGGAIARGIIRGIITSLSGLGDQIVAKIASEISARTGLPIEVSTALMLVGARSLPVPNPAGAATPAGVVRTLPQAPAGPRLSDEVLPAGFQHGGSFLVGGASGIDTNLVSFRATRGERVTVETPAQQQRGGGDIHLHLYNPVIRQEEDIDRLAAAIEQKLALSWLRAERQGTAPALGVA